MNRLSFRRSVLLALVAALAGCGGGSTSSLPSATSTSAPAPQTPTPSPYPSTSGDSFTYKGSISQTFTRMTSPAPSPDTWSSSVSQSVSVKSGASFQGTSGLTDFETKETDSGNYATTTSDTHQYMSFAKNATRWNGMDLLQAGSVSSDSGGVTITTTYGPGNGLMDELPEVPQAQWINNAARTVVENDPSGEKLTSAYAGDGTYTQNVTFSNGDTSTAIESADGSGQYTMPLLANPNGTPSYLTFSAPQSDGTIALTFVDNADADPQIFTKTVSTWYSAAAPGMASDTITDAGTVAIPSSCNVASSLATQATRLDETRTRLDTIFGELETLTQSAYVAAPYGVVCLVAHDRLVNYYDMTGQAAFLDGFAGTPMQQTDTNETLGMQTATLAAQSSARRKASISQGAAIFARPSLANIELRVAKRRLTFVHHLSAALRKAR